MKVSDDWWRTSDGVFGGLGNLNICDISVLFTFTLNLCMYVQRLNCSDNMDHPEFGSHLYVLRIIIFFLMKLYSETNFSP